MNMLENLITMLQENRTVAIGAGLGTLGGILGGVFLGSSMLTTILFAAGLGAAGLVGGAVGGHYVSRQMDRNTPAPLGVRAVESPKIEAGKEGALTFKPSVELSDKVAAEAESALRRHPEFKEYEGYLPLVRNILPYSKIILKGKASADGTSIEIATATVTAPGFDPVTMPVKGLTMPMKDGKIDENDPESKKKMKEFLRQFIKSRVPAKYQAEANEALERMVLKEPEIQLAPDEGRGRDMLAKALGNGTSMPLGGNAALPLAKPAGERMI